MAEHIMEDVRLGQVVQLFAIADETTGHEAAIGQVFVEFLFRDQARNRHDRPAGELFQLLVDAAKVGNAALIEVQHFQSAEVLGRCAALQHRHLTFIERRPDAVLLGGVALPHLVDGKVGGGRLFRHDGIVDRHVSLRWLDSFICN